MSFWRTFGSKVDGVQLLFPFNCQRGLKNPFTQSPLEQRSTTPEQQTNKRLIKDIPTPRKSAGVNAKI